MGYVIRAVAFHECGSVTWAYLVEDTIQRREIRRRGPDRGSGA